MLLGLCRGLGGVGVGGWNGARMVERVVDDNRVRLKMRIRGKYSNTNVLMRKTLEGYGTLNISKEGLILWNCLLFLVFSS